MHIYSLSFLFLFLPASAVLYYLTPARGKTIALFFISLYFMATLSLVGLGIMLGSVVVDYLLSKPVYFYGKGDRRAKAALYACAVKNILLFTTLSSVSQLGLMQMPVGVLVYAFTALGYVSDLYNGEIDPARNFWEFGLFCCFFGKLYIGPIVSFSSFSEQLAARRPSMSKISQGVSWLLHGLAKQLILADSILVLAKQFKDIPYLEKTVLSVWLLIACYVFYAYYSLSGYSDMARGTGAILGIDLPENFHYPLQADSVTDFFSRFNISANRFVRKYVYSALGAQDNGRLPTTLNIMLITMLMGLWYGIGLNYLVWGAFLGVFIVLETLFEESFFRRIRPFFRHVYTFVVVILSFAWYSSRSISQALFYLQAMFGLRAHISLVNNQCLYLLHSNWLLLLACALFCTNFFSVAFKRLQLKSPLFSQILSLLENLIILVLILAFLL